MKILKHPPDVNAWVYTFSCRCGAELQACVADIKRVYVRERQGTEVSYYVTCPCCQQDRDMAIPPHIKREVDRRLSGSR